MKVVRVEWVDSRSVRAEWLEYDLFDEERLNVLESVGFLASEDDERIILVSCNDPHMEKYSGGIIIPKVAIVKRKILK